MFDRIHGRYDLLNRVLSLGLDRFWRRRAVRELGLQPGDRVLDLCCGTGDLTAELARDRVGEVLGMDFSPLMLEEARRKFPRLQFNFGDALQTGLPDASVDAVTMAFGPRNIPDLQALWTELRRILRPGGQVLTLECTRPRGVLGWMHRFYLAYVLPTLGGLLAGDRSAYRYLSRTVAGFLDARELEESMRQGGLQQVRSMPMSAGIVTVHLARTPDA